MNALKIVLSNETKNQEYELNFSILDKPISRRWANRLKCEILEKKLLINIYNFMGFINGPRGLREISGDMNKAIDIINGFSWSDGYSIMQRASSDMGQETLNALHHHFELMFGKTWNKAKHFLEADGKTRTALLCLNIYIHEFEDMQRAMAAANGDKEQICSRINFSFVGRETFGLEQEDFNEFQFEKDFGDVLLHYCHTGKTFVDAFYDKDDEIHDDNIIGLKSYSSEFDIDFGPYRGESETNGFVSELKDWLIKKGFDPQDKRLSLGDITIGKFSPNAIQMGKRISEIQDEIANHPKVRRIVLDLDGEKYTHYIDYDSEEFLKKWENYLNVNAGK